MLIFNLQSSELSKVELLRYARWDWHTSSQQTQNICITFVQRRPNVFDVGSTLYKCHTNILCLLGCRPSYEGGIHFVSPWRYMLTTRLFNADKMLVQQLRRWYTLRQRCKNDLFWPMFWWKGGTGMIASSSTFRPHPGRVIRDLFRLLDAVTALYGSTGLQQSSKGSCSLLVSGYNLRADCQWRTLVPPLKGRANAAPASVLALM